MVNGPGALASPAAVFTIPIEPPCCPPNAAPRDKRLPPPPPRSTVINPPSSSPAKSTPTNAGLNSLRGKGGAFDVQSIQNLEDFELPDSDFDNLAIQMLGSNSPTPNAIMAATALMFDRPSSRSSPLPDAKKSGFTKLHEKKFKTQRRLELARARQCNRRNEARDSFKEAKIRAEQEAKLEEMEQLLSSEPATVSQHPGHRTHPPPVPIEIQRNVAQDIRNDVERGQRPCLCCDGRYMDNSTLVFDPFEISSSPRRRILENIAKVCKPPKAKIEAGEVTQAVWDYYDVSQSIPSFKNCLLSKRGIISDVSSGPPNAMEVLASLKDELHPLQNDTPSSKDSLDGFLEEDNAEANEEERRKIKEAISGIAPRNNFDEDDCNWSDVGEAVEARSVTIILCDTCEKFLDRELKPANDDGEIKPPARAICNVLYFMGDKVNDFMDGVPPFVEKFFSVGIVLHFKKYKLGLRIQRIKILQCWDSTAFHTNLG